MGTLGESLKQYQQLVYSFSNSSRSITTLQYADDTCLAADGPSSCQKLLNHVDRWLSWSGMRAKVPKCYFLALQESTAGPYDQKLTLQGATVHFIGNNPVKFLGAFIQIPPDQQRVKDHLDGKLLSLLEKVDSAPITRNQKLLLYKAGVCPRMLWDMGILDLSTSWITRRLETTVTRYLKKWLGLSRSADPARLYLPKKNGGLILPSITTLYKKVKVSIACQLLMSRDQTTQQVARIQVLKEESQKRSQFQPILLAREVIASDPGARQQTILKQAKTLVLTEGVERQLDHTESLTKQGQLHELVDDEAATLWSEVVQKLPPADLKFALNVAQATLPHNANLSVWRSKEGLSDQCKPCNQCQTLLHVLNHCQVTLGLRCFNIRHDNVLKMIFGQLRHQCSQDFQIAADLPGSTYSFPPSVASTDMRPDLVMWSNAKQVVILVELTICFETNFVDASLRKSE